MPKLLIKMAESLGVDDVFANLRWKWTAKKQSENNAENQSVDTPEIQLRRDFLFVNRYYS